MLNPKYGAKVRFIKENFWGDLKMKPNDNNLLTHAVWEVKIQNEDFYIIELLFFTNDQWQRSEWPNDAAGIMTAKQLFPKISIVLHGFLFLYGRI